MQVGKAGRPLGWEGPAGGLGGNGFSGGRGVLLAAWPGSRTSPLPWEAPRQYS